jgi:hypothetical protein
MKTKGREDKVTNGRERPNWSLRWRINRRCKIICEGTKNARMNRFWKLAYTRTHAHTHIRTHTFTHTHMHPHALSHSQTRTHTRIVAPFACCPWKFTILNNTKQRFKTNASRDCNRVHAFLPKSNTVRMGLCTEIRKLKTYILY